MARRHRAREHTGRTEHDGQEREVSKGKGRYRETGRERERERECAQGEGCARTTDRPTDQTTDRRTNEWTDGRMNERASRAAVSKGAGTGRARGEEGGVRRQLQAMRGSVDQAWPFTAEYTARARETRGGRKRRGDYRSKRWRARHDLLRRSPRLSSAPHPPHPPSPSPSSRRSSNPRSRSTRPRARGHVTLPLSLSLSRARATIPRATLAELSLSVSLTLTLAPFVHRRRPFLFVTLPTLSVAAPLDSLFSSLSISNSVCVCVCARASLQLASRFSRPVELGISPSPRLPSPLLSLSIACKRLVYPLAAASSLSP